MDSIKKENTRMKKITNGVPQGLMLRLILFHGFINGFRKKNSRRILITQFAEYTTQQDVISREEDKILYVKNWRTLETRVIEIQ